MSDDEIKAIAAQLEAEVRVEDAKFLREEDWVDDNGIRYCLVANRAGFLRLAVLMLSGAVAGENVVSAALPKFENKSAEPFFDKLERREEWPETPLKDAPLNANQRIGLFLEGVGCWLFVAVTLFLMVVGLITVWKWIF